MGVSYEILNGPLQWSLVIGHLPRAIYDVSMVEEACRVAGRYVVFDVSGYAAPHYDTQQGNSRLNRSATWTLEGPAYVEVE